MTTLPYDAPEVKSHACDLVSFLIRERHRLIRQFPGRFIGRDVQPELLAELGDLRRVWLASNVAEDLRESVRRRVPLCIFGGADGARRSRT